MSRFMPEIIYDANAAVIAISQMVQKAVVGVSDASLPMNWGSSSCVMYLVSLDTISASALDVRIWSFTSILVRRVKNSVKWAFFT